MYSWPFCLLYFFFLFCLRWQWSKHKGTSSAISSTGSLSGETSAGSGRSGGVKQKEQKHTTRTYNNLNINKVVVELGQLTQSFVALDFPRWCDGPVGGVGGLCVGVNG